MSETTEENGQVNDGSWLPGRNGIERDEGQVLLSYEDEMQ